MAPPFPEPNLETCVEEVQGLAEKPSHQESCPSVAVEVVVATKQGPCEVQMGRIVDHLRSQATGKRQQSELGPETLAPLFVPLAENS